MSETKVGRIYKIVCTQSDHCYVGSTFNTIRDRFHGHKGAYATWLKDESTAKCSIYPYFKQFGVANFRMILIKEYEVVDRTHLEVYEALWISKLTCVNKNVPFFLKPLYNKQYREDNRERIVAQKQRHYELNKERLCVVAKAYRANNKEKVKDAESNRTRPEAYTLQRNIKHDCDCGGKFTHSNRAVHAKSKKHITWLADTAQQ